jgi:predicted RNase H-like HicB family nuclease
MWCSIRRWKMAQYPYVVEKQEDGKYLVQFTDFPQGFTEGDTPEEASKNAAEVLALLVADYKADGFSLPTPSAPNGNPVVSI